MVCADGLRVARSFRKSANQPGRGSRCRPGAGTGFIRTQGSGLVVVSAACHVLECGRKTMHNHAYAPNESKPMRDSVFLQTATERNSVTVTDRSRLGPGWRPLRGNYARTSSARYAGSGCIASVIAPVSRAADTPVGPRP
jgi:hypothetical protein